MKKWVGLLALMLPLATYAGPCEDAAQQMAHLYRMKLHGATAVTLIDQIDPHDLWMQQKRDVIVKMYFPDLYHITSPAQAAQQMRHECRMRLAQDRFADGLTILMEN